MHHVQLLSMPDVRARGRGLIDSARIGRSWLRLGYNDATALFAISPMRAKVDCLTSLLGYCTMQSANELAEEAD